MKCTYCKRETFRTILPSRAGLGLVRTRDHVIPLSKGGQDVPGNRVVACSKCNNLKADMMPAEWKQFMRQNPLWWTMTKLDRNQRREALRTAKWGLRRRVKATASEMKAMTATENARRLEVYLAASANEVTVTPNPSRRVER